MASASPVIFSAAFDGGNGELIEGSVSAGVYTAKVNMGKEPYTEGTDKREHHQWFYFKASNLDDVTTCIFRIVNAGSSSYPAAWPGTRAVAAYGDRSTWFRTQTTYNGESGELCVTVDVTGQSFVYIAYFAPFTYDQHLDLIAKCVLSKEMDGSPMCAVATVALTKQGREVQMITTGNGPLKLWFIARQHPGESMAEWWAQGFLQRLLSADDDLARKVRAAATIRCVPNMNPDGAVLGHLRTNACGANLNREWASTGDYVAPTTERSPEVFAVLQQVTQIGCDLFVDVHGDEELPHIFFAGAQGIPKWNDRHAELYRMFAGAQLRYAKSRIRWQHCARSSLNQIPGQRHLTNDSHAAAHHGPL